MTNYYVNNITGSDINGGTSESDAWAGITHWTNHAVSGFTGGDHLWIKGTTMMYDVLKTGVGVPNEGLMTSTIYNPSIYISGYYAVTGDDCVDGLKPTLTRHIEAPGYSVYSNWDLMPGGRATIENLHFWGHHTRTPWINTVTMRTGPKNTYRNISAHVAYPYSTGMRAPLFGTDSANDATNTSLIGLQGSVGANYSQYTNTVFLSGARRQLYGAQLDASLLTENKNFIDAPYTDYSYIIQNGNLMIGNPNAEHIGYNYPVQTNIYSLAITNCIFVNMHIGIKLTTTETSVQPYWISTQFIIRNCLFVNCTTGIEFDTSNLSDWEGCARVDHNKFYNCTTANITGYPYGSSNKTLTENPWDDVAKTLNGYGKSIMGFPYKVIDFGTGLSGPDQQSIITTSGRDLLGIAGRLKEERSGGVF